MRNLEIEPLKSWLSDYRQSKRYEAAIHTLYGKIFNSNRGEEKIQEVIREVMNEHRTISSTMAPKLIGLWENYCEDTQLALEEILELKPESYEIRTLCNHILLQEYLENLMNENGEIPARLPAVLTSDELILLHQFLLSNKYIERTSGEDFIYRMGIQQGVPTFPKRICWIKNKQVLHDMINTLYDEQLREKTVRKSDIERRIPLCFEETNGHAIELSKYKAINSEDVVLMMQFIDRLFKKRQ